MELYYLFSTCIALIIGKGQKIQLLKMSDLYIWKTNSFDINIGVFIMSLYFYFILFFLSFFHLFLLVGGQPFHT